MEKRGLEALTARMYISFLITMTLILFICCFHTALIAVVSFRRVFGCGVTEQLSTIATVGRLTTPFGGSTAYKWIMEVNHIRHIISTVWCCDTEKKYIAMQDSLVWQFQVLVCASLTDCCVFWYLQKTSAGMIMSVPTNFLSSVPKTHKDSSQTHEVKITNTGLVFVMKTRHKSHV